MKLLRRKRGSYENTLHLVNGNVNGTCSYASRAMLSIMVIVEHPMNKYIAAQRWTAFANCPVNLSESLMR